MSYSVTRCRRVLEVCVDRVGNIYFTDNFNHTVRKMLMSGQIITIAGLAEAIELLKSDHPVKTASAIPRRSRTIDQQLSELELSVQRAHA